MLVLLLFFFCGCRKETRDEPTPSPTVSLRQRADRALADKDYETAALAYRELLDRLENEKADEKLQQETREKCTEALVWAGGFAASLELWERIAEERPSSKKEAQHMAARAKRMMLQQGDELLALGLEDSSAGHRSKAQATISATEVLYRKGGADQARLKSLHSALERQEFGRR